jgi:hypothetical protein
MSTTGKESIVSTKTAIILAVTMAILSYVHDTVRVGMSIRPEPACREAAHPARALQLSAHGLTVRVPVDGGTVEVRIDRIS